MSNTKYPLYRKANKTVYNSHRFAGTIVEFTANKTGKVVYSPPNGPKDVGYDASDWISHDDSECWMVCDNPKPVDEVVEKWTNAALDMAQFVHAECKDVPHDIGLKLMDIVKKHYTLQ
jgi:hypothetical protein